MPIVHPVSLFLGIDVGTTNVKALRHRRPRAVRSPRACEPLGMRAPQPGWAEQNPDRLVEGGDRAR